jgi:hypothetical protein
MHFMQRRIQMSKKSEKITLIPIKKLIPFRDHPYQVRDDEQMRMLTESIRAVFKLLERWVKRKQ